jgi:hypothetical protein
MKPNALLKAIGCAIAVTLCFAGSARSANFELEKKDAVFIGKLITSTAHPTGKNPAYVDHTVAKDKTDRYTITVNTVYYGALSGKKYSAKIKVRIDTDTGGKGGFEILDIDYSDDNSSFKAGDLDPAKRRLNEVYKP